MPTAFNLGGTGQIGRATAMALHARNWTVTVASRDPKPFEGIAVVAFDRRSEGALARALGAGADLLIDAIGYDADDSAQLLAVQDQVGHLLTISSASVYRDAEDRTLDEARQNGFPDMPDPITEAQPTVAPGPQTYSTRKVAMEQRLLDGARVPATVVRPCAIYGVGSSHPREWWFIKRVLDGRRRIPLAHSGQSRFHPSATVNIAALIATIADRKASGTFNAVDPAAPTVLEIGRAVLAALGSEAELIPAEGAVPVGGTPWSTPLPFVLSDAAARAIGYLPVADHAEAIVPVCHWLAGLPPDDWQRRFPPLAGYGVDLFDYTAEDGWLASGPRTVPPL